jgi:hypothetical protein
VLKPTRKSTYAFFHSRSIHRIIGDALKIPRRMILGSDNVKRNGTVRLEPAAYF